MKYIFFIILIIIAIFISYKIITPFSFPSKYYENDEIKWHFFTKDKNIIREFTKYVFFIKSIHLAGDFKEIKAVEIQTFLPFFIFKFYQIKGFSLEKTHYGILYYKNLSFKGIFERTGVLSDKGKSFGFIKTNPEINFKIKKSHYFEFESNVGAGLVSARNEIFKIKNFDFEIYKASSPHFSLLFPEIEEIEAYYKKNNCFFRIKEKGKEKILKFGEIIEPKDLFKEEELSFYIKVNDTKFLKKFIKSHFFEYLKEIEIKCTSDETAEKCKGYFSIKSKF